MSRNLLGVPRVRYTGGGASFDLASAESDDATDRTRTVDVPSWVDKVKDAIPIEVVTAWAAIEAILGKGGLIEATVTLGPLMVNPYLALIAVMAVVTALHMWVDVETPTRGGELPFAYLKQTQYAQIALAVLGFLVWAYYLGGLYGRSLLGLYDATAATVLLPLYVVAGPQLVPSVLRKLHGVEVDGGSE